MYQAIPQDGSPVMGVYPLLPPVGPILAVKEVSPMICAGFQGLGPLDSVSSYKLPVKY